MPKKGKFRSELDPVMQTAVEEDDGITLEDLDREDIALIVRVFHFAKDHGMFLRNEDDRRQLVRLPRSLLTVMHDNGIPYFPDAA